MTIYVSPFVLGILCTIGAEIIALIITAIVYSKVNSRKTSGNASNLVREDEDEKEC